MEFLRFGSSIPGTYWGCCAVCIIQNFNHDPDTKSSIEIVSGDSGSAIMKGSEKQFAGPTYGDIFRQRIRIGTFSAREMQDHAFFAILTEYQCGTATGKKWLKLLQEEGFEFLRKQDNSVYGPNHPNYVFALFRNIRKGFDDMFSPPAAWLEVTKKAETKFTEPYKVIQDAIGGKKLTSIMQEEQLDRWNAGKVPKFLTEAEVKKAGAPVVLAGKRSRYPQQTADARDSSEAADKNMVKQTALKTSPPAPSSKAKVAMGPNIDVV